MGRQCVEHHDLHLLLAVWHQWTAAVGEDASCAVGELHRSALHGVLRGACTFACFLQDGALGECSHAEASLG